MSTVLTGAAYHTELIDGREVEKPLSKLLHARIQSFLIRVLASLLSKRVEVSLGIERPLRKRSPRPPRTGCDSGSPHNAEYRDGDLFDPAILCVEILSPGQTLSNLLDKAERLLKGGTPSCWLIWPERRQAWIYRQDELREATESLSATLADGERLEINLSDMWAELE